MLKKTVAIERATLIVVTDADLPVHGMEGKVVEVYPDGDVRVQMETNQHILRRDQISAVGKVEDDAPVEEKPVVQPTLLEVQRATLQELRSKNRDGDFYNEFLRLLA